VDERIRTTPQQGPAPGGRLDGQGAS
jgi:hypothetical protein